MGIKQESQQESIPFHSNNPTTRNSKWSYF